MKEQYKKEIIRIKKLSDDMIRIFDFEDGLKRIPTEQEINSWAMTIDMAMLCKSKRVRNEALELTMWMSELVRRFCKLKIQTTGVEK